MSDSNEDDSPEAQVQLPAELGADLRKRIEAATKDILAQRQRSQVVDRIMPAVLASLQTSITTVQIASRHHSGPIPTAETVEGYERILPGAADRIFRMAEDDQAGFLEAQRDKRRRDDRYRLVGLVLGFVSLATIVGTVIWLAQAGHEGPAIALAGLGIVGVVGAFIRGNILGPGKPKADDSTQ